MDEFNAIGRNRKDFTTYASGTMEDEGVTRVNLEGVSNSSAPVAPDFSGFGPAGLEGPDDFNTLDAVSTKEVDVSTGDVESHDDTPVSGVHAVDDTVQSAAGVSGDIPVEDESESSSGESKSLPHAPSVAVSEEPVASSILEQDISSVFHRISVSDDILEQYSKKYNTDLEAVECIADSKKLLSYMVEQERKHAITMPFHATGIDPICFFSSLDEDAEAPFVGIELPDGEQDFYECIEVDNALFLSCVSRVIDEDYLQRIISEAAEALYTHGIYRYTMRGPKPLRTEVPGQMLETLKLNTYELSILQSYIDSIPNVSHTMVREDDHSVIVFRRED